ncbi:MAG: hypothetical protein SFY95_02210 [Planctomycetota bacterium]|nr:hypothetical protein [Planctomycetota bacterium]
MTTLPSFFRLRTARSDAWGAAWQRRLRRGGLAFIALASVLTGAALSLKLAQADAVLQAPTELILAVAALLVLPVAMWATAGQSR